MQINFFKSAKLAQVKEVARTSYLLCKLVWKTNKLIFTLQLIAVLVPAITPFIVAYLFKLIIDIVVSAVAGNSINYQYLYFLMALTLVMSYLNRMSFGLQNYASKVMYTRMPLSLYQIVLNKLVSLDLKYFEDSKFRDMLQKIKESYEYRPQNLLTNLFFSFQGVLQMAIALVALLTLSPLFAIILVLTALPDLYNQVRFSKISWGIWGEHVPQRKKFDYLTNLIQTGSNIKETKIFQTAGKFLNEISKIQHDFFNDNKKMLDRQLKINSGFTLFDIVVNFSILFYVITQALAKRITVGDISFYQSVIGNFNQGLGGFFRTITQVFEQSLYVKYIFELLDIETEIKVPDDAVKVDYNKTPKIEFKNVTFSYPGTKQKVLNNLSLTINPGEKVAFVGENGAGKTTLIKLLARFYDIDSGEILIDGINLKKLDLSAWNRCIGVLFQDFIKYEYPVKDNIYLGRIWEKENLESIINAAKSAGADPMIKKFDKEYEQMLGRTFEGGLELSGGQWQKIALARAFFRNAPVLVLDEPTANIDAKAEAEIFQRVENLSKDKTVIIISHRFSTVRNADKIYVIDNGKIKESGSHEELMKFDSQYASLFKLQAKGYQ